MGNTLRNTAWSPTSARSFWGTLDWRNLSYDVFWMSMRFGTSMTFRTRPRCLRMRKFDWMTFAIGAPDLFVCYRGLDASLPSDAVRRTFLRGRPGMRICPARDLPAAVDLSRKLGRVKQKARRRGNGSLVRGKDYANDRTAGHPRPWA